MLYCLTGTLGPSPNTCANRSRARPLLVVHSGNITTGARAVFLISSRDRACVNDGASAPKGGTLPVEESIVRRETSLKPRIGLRERGVDAVVGSETLADPVPVLRPVARAEDLVLSTFSTGGVATGRTKTGLKRNASQRISKYETQLETIRSPALGFHGSVRASLPARLLKRKPFVSKRTKGTMYRLALAYVASTPLGSSRSL